MYPEHLARNRKKRLLQIAVILILIGIALLFVHLQKIQAPAVVMGTATSTSDALAQDNPFNAVALQAKSVYVYDIARGQAIFEKNPGTQLPLASVTKVMTVLTASNIIPQYQLVSITQDNLRPDGDSGLLVGERWNIKKLVDFALVVSSNDAMNAIASVAGAELAPSMNKTSEELFIDKMNVLARSIGLTQTYFVNESGLDVSDMTSGGYGSARDMAKLFEYIVRNKPTLLEATQYTTLPVASETKVHTADNTNKIVGEIPGIIASKTGLTDLSGGNLVVAFDAGLMRPIVISILGSTEDGRFSDMRQLVDATLKYLENQVK